MTTSCIIAAIGLSILPQAQPPATGQAVPNLFPDSVRIEQFVVTPDSQRTYYTTQAGGVWVYDRRLKAATRLLGEAGWDLSLSRAGDALAFTRPGETRREQFVWIQPLSPTTGLAAGPPRQVSALAGDGPAISPDGKWIAFARDDSTGVGQSVVVASVKGGSERVVAARMPSGVSVVRWTPDGKSIYFGVNAPVPFTCAESCLTGARETRPQPTIRRVPAGGGTVDVVATGSAPSPGLSPDGKFLVYRDTGAARQLVLADADGRRLQTLSVPGAQVPHTWMGASTVLTLATGEVRRLVSVAVASGERRSLAEIREFGTQPSWSPDSRVASFIRFMNGCELRLLPVDGAAPSATQLTTGGGCANVSWTPDRRWVVFTHYQSAQRLVVAALEVATGQRKELRVVTDPNATWVLDRDAVIVAEAAPGAAAAGRVIVSKVDFAGGVTPLREIEPGQGGNVIPLDRTRAVVTRTNPREVRLVSLDAGGAERVLLSPAASVTSAPPSFSADREWIAVRLTPTAGDTSRRTVVELMRVDGSAHRQIRLPFFTEPFTEAAILPAGKGVIVIERRRQDQPPGVYVVDAATQAATKLMSYVPGGRWPDIALSPDGATLLALTTELAPPAVSAIDLSAVRPAPRP